MCYLWMLVFWMFLRSWSWKYSLQQLQSAMKMWGRRSSDGQEPLLWFPKSWNGSISVWAIKTGCTLNEESSDRSGHWKVSDSKSKHFLWALKFWRFPRFLSQNAQDVFFFMCFFVNNQFRIIVEGSAAGSDNLEEVFEDNLKRIGQVVAVLDRRQRPVLF